MEKGASLELCPHCGAIGARVVDSRLNSRGRVRKRICSNCKHEWRTVEIPLESYISEDGLYAAKGVISRAINALRQLEIKLPEGINNV